MGVTRFLFKGAPSRVAREVDTGEDEEEAEEEEEEEAGVEKIATEEGGSASDPSPVWAACKSAFSDAISAPVVSERRGRGEGLSGDDDAKNGPRADVAAAAILRKSGRCVVVRRERGGASRCCRHRR